MKDMKFTLCGGWCKHGIMEANRCDKCIEEWRAAGLDVQWHEGDAEAFKKALEEIFKMEQGKK